MARLVCTSQILAHGIAGPSKNAVKKRQCTHILTTDIFLLAAWLQPCPTTTVVVAIEDAPVPPPPEHNDTLSLVTATHMGGVLVKWCRIPF